MLWNCLTVGFRNLRRHTFYSLLNILGLAVGIACMLLAVLYVGYQFRFDQHHERATAFTESFEKSRMSAASATTWEQSPSLRIYATNSPKLRQ